jgi:hypothetical protein
MSERSVQVVVSGQGGQQIQVRLQADAPDRPLVLQVASGAAAAPARFDAGVAVVRASNGARAISLELRFREPAPLVVEPEPAREPAPLAAAWAAARRLRQRSPSSTPPRPRTQRARG